MISVHGVSGSQQASKDALYLLQLLRLGVHDQVDEKPG